MATAGFSHSLFTKTDGSLWAMGNNFNGELGDGTTDSRSTPTQVATDVSMTSAGSGHSLFIKTDGSLWAMGSNFLGALGDGTTTDRATPIQIATNVSAVSTGRHSLFIKADGSLWGMGTNFNGELGEDSLASRSTSTQVGTEIVDVQAGIRIPYSLEKTVRSGRWVKTAMANWVMGLLSITQHPFKSLPAFPQFRLELIIHCSSIPTEVFGEWVGTKGANWATEQP